MFAILILFLLLVVALYVLTNGSFEPSLVSASKTISNFFFTELEEIKELEKEVAGVVPSRPEEVFHVPNQRFTFEEAKAFCRALGVRMATLNEVKKAYLRGAQWATMGWTDGQLGLYVLQPHYVRRHPGAGEIGVNGGFFKNPEVRMGINCFGVKPQPDPSRIEYSYSELDDEVVEVDENGVVVVGGKRADYKQMLEDGEIVIGPWNENRWSRESKEESRYHMYGANIHPEMKSEEKPTVPTVVSSKDSKDSDITKVKDSKDKNNDYVMPVNDSKSNIDDKAYSAAVANLSRSHIQNLI
jgi:hypothetical protein